MVEAGEADVEAQPKLGKQLVVEVVELLRDVVAQQGRKEAGDVSLSVQEKVKIFPGPGNVATFGLSRQRDLRRIRSREERV